MRDYRKKEGRMEVFSFFNFGFLVAKFVTYGFMKQSIKEEL